MPHATILGFSFYELLWYFVIYSVIGWGIETIYESVRQGKLVNRGFLNGCYCPIYGFGFLGILFTFSRFVGRPFVLFFGGMIFATVLEYFTGWLMETVFGSRWWDYSDSRFNLKGRISLFTSISWGLLCLIFIEFIQPQISRKINSIGEQAGGIALAVIYAIGFIDFAFSLSAAIKLSSRVMALARLKDKMIAIALQNAPIEEAENIKRKFLSSRVGEILTEAAERIRNATAETMILNRPSLMQKLEKVREKYEQLVGRASSNERRFFTAFPKLHFPKLRELSDELRDRITGNDDNKK